MTNRTTQALVPGSARDIAFKAILWHGNRMSSKLHVDRTINLVDTVIIKLMQHGWSTSLNQYILNPVRVDPSHFIVRF